MLRMILAFASTLAALGCGPPPPLASGGVDDSDVVTRCGFEPIAFDAHGEGVVQGASADGEACARVDREPLGVRRGGEWQTLRFRASTSAASFDVTDPVALGYVNTHHNCMDQATVVVEGVQHGLVIDGAAQDANVCFSSGVEGWRLVLRIDGVEHVLAPYSGSG